MADSAWRRGYLTDRLKVMATMVVVALLGAGFVYLVVKWLVHIHGCP